MKYIIEDDQHEPELVEWPECEGCPYWSDEEGCLPGGCEIDAVDYDFYDVPREEVNDGISSS